MEITYAGVDFVSTLMPEQLFGLAIFAIALVILKGFALYKAARLKEQVWFWVILLLNTAGILPAVYLYIKRKRKA